MIAFRRWWHFIYRIDLLYCFFLRAKVYIRAREQFLVYNFRHPLSFSSLPYPVRGRAFPARRATRNQRSGDKFPCARVRMNRAVEIPCMYTGNAQVGLFGREYRKWADSRAQMFARDAYYRRPLPRFSPSLPSQFA